MWGNVCVCVCSIETYLGKQDKKYIHHIANNDALSYKASGDSLTSIISTDREVKVSPISYRTAAEKLCFTSLVLLFFFMQINVDI